MRKVMVDMELFEVLIQMANLMEEETCKTCPKKAECDKGYSCILNDKIDEVMFNITMKED